MGTDDYGEMHRVQNCEANTEEEQFFNIYIYLEVVIQCWKVRHLF